MPMSAAVSSSLRTEGIRHFHRKEYASALACFDQYLSSHSGDRDLFNYKARIFAALGRTEESLSYIDRCLQLEPNDVGELCNRALLLTRLSRRGEALACFDKALSTQPNHTDVLIKRAHLLHSLGRRDDALRSAERAVAIAPANLAALNMRGMVLDDLERREEALADFLAILTIDPNYPDAITNRGIIHGRRGQFREALDCYDKSLSINSDQPNAFYNRAVVRMVLGDWPRGFREFETRWKLFPHEAGRLTRLAPIWLGGGSIAGKTILLHHEQGYGDTLQFSRYAALVSALGARVIMAVPAGLRKLMKSLPGSPQIVAEGEPVPAHDYHCPLMSLPLAFGTTTSNVPAEVPYLRAEPSAVSRWGERLVNRGQPRIGLVWSGRQFPPINYARDMSFEVIRPLFALNAEFICLHTEMPDHERKLLANISNLVWLGRELKDFADTAALIENLDLIISVDSAVAHLAGALGKPVWLMNRYASCWRWLLERSDSPWYPTLRQFRQPTLGDWRTVVRDVLDAGEGFIREDMHSRSGNVQSVLARDLAGMLQSALNLHNQSRFTEVIDSYRRILQFFPGQFDTLHYLGVALAQVGRCQEALVPLLQALTLQPDNGAVHNHYGNALAGLSQYSEAIQSYERAIACDGTLADAHYNCGVAWAALSRPDLACLCYSKAIELNPNYAQAHNNLGSLLSDSGKIPEALRSYERAIQTKPTFADPWINRCHLLRRMHRYDEALHSSEHALRCDPNNAGTYNCRGATLADLGRFEEALTNYDRAIELNPSLAEARWNKALIKLARGEFREGWDLYESRWGVKSLKLIQRFPDKPVWRGTEPIDGKVLLLHAEQGYGDTIQFSRYATLFASRGARVILGVPQSLRSLLATIPGVESAVSQTSTPQFDLHSSLMSLPLALGTTLTDIPAAARYLQPDPSLVSKWARRLGKPTKVPRIGLAWSGSASHVNDLNRSISLKELLPLTRPGFKWISVQKEVRGADGPHLASASQVLRLGEEVTDFADTAGLLENLDLVITVDTVIAHLAGALGKPVWILLPYVADWRWLQVREDSPWYPSARLFRQSVRGDWASVVLRIAAELHREFKSRRARARLTKGAKSVPGWGLSSHKR
jgi:tetratricopeptide (TPR) repeat protein